MVSLYRVGVVTYWKSVIGFKERYFIPLSWALLGAIRVVRFVTSPHPHRPVRADFPHTVPHHNSFAKDSCEQLWVWLTVYTR